MAEELGEKTEQPTGRRLSDARGKGQVAKSTELAGAIELGMAMIMLIVIGGWLFSGLGGVMRRVLEVQSDLTTTSVSDLMRTVRWAGMTALTITGPVLLIMFVVAALAHVWQVGLKLTTYPLQPKLDRLNPIAGVKRILGIRGLVKTALSIVKLAITSALGSIVIIVNMPEIVGLPNLHAMAAVSVLIKLIMLLAIWMIVVFLVLGVLDMIYQRWQHNRDLRMTKQEVKDERRSLDGDPEVKRRRAQIAYELAMQRIRKDVPQADVIITNPTHFAIALKYDPEKMASPMVTAKGADLMAYRIRELAAVHRIPIVERPPLARALYHNVEVGQSIHPEHFEAVAEVLAYVYRLERQIA